MSVNISALKIHMSEEAHSAIMAFPEFITECRGDIAIKVWKQLLYTGWPKNAATAFVADIHTLKTLKQFARFLAFPFCAQDTSSKLRTQNNAILEA